MLIIIESSNEGLQWLEINLFFSHEHTIVLGAKMALLLINSILTLRRETESNIGQAVEKRNA